MFALKQFIGRTVFLLMIAGTTVAQENRAPIDQPTVASAPLVTATATARRVRFVSPGTVVQLRLEVYNDAGQKLFDTELRGGNVLDWLLQDGAGQQLPGGSYACVLTTKSLSGRLSQRVGLVTVNGEKAAIETAAQLSLAQQQTIGPLEGNATFTILAEARPSARAQTDSIQKPPHESEAEALTTVTHDGNDGQMSRTRGALSFRVGNVFAGKDKEQMRLTEDGNLGIGTSKPEAMLDVAGMIRAREGFMFSDGSTLKINEKGLLTRTSADGSDLKSTTATTQNKIAKFTDNLGTLGDSVITESAAGNIGIGTTNPQSLLQVGPHQGYGATTGLLITNNLTGTQFDRGFQLAPRQTANPLTNSILIYALPTINPGVTVPSQYGFFVDGRQGSGAITSYAAIATGQNPSLGAANNTHLLLGSLAIPAGNFSIYDNTNFKSYFRGNVGIGTNNASAKLDVVGDINTSTQYKIGGSRVLGVGGGGGNSTYAGLAAGVNASGGNNSFFGFGAGSSNTAGDTNSFFGANAGHSNTIEYENTFIGAFSNGAAGVTNATALGYRAQVTRSDSLVLGGINTVNGAIASTNVGIGTPEPAYPLTVSGTAGVNQHQGAVEFSNGVPDTGLRLRNTTANGKTWTIFSSGTASGIGAGNFSIFDVDLNLTRVAITPAGTVKVNVLGTSGTTPLCHNASNEISTCTPPTVPALAAIDAGGDAASLDTIKRQQLQIEAQRAWIERLEARLADLERFVAETVAKAKHRP